MNANHSDLSLVCRVQKLLYAVPLAHVAETMRPLPTEPVAGAPGFVLGLAVIRGVPVPVLDVGLLCGGAPASPSRFVAISAGQRPVALAVDAVLGARPIDAAALHELPPLLKDASGGVASAIGTLDAELLLVLRCARLLPADLPALLDAVGTPA